MSTVATLVIPDSYTDTNPVMYSVRRHSNVPITERYSVFRIKGSGTERLRSFQSADGAVQYASMMLAEDIALAERR